MTVEEFAQVLLEQTKEKLARDFSQRQADWTVVQVKPGKKYTKVDVGPKHNISGKYMVENSTGAIFGIKGYGVVHKGHQYGTLETVHDWYWGGYTAEKREKSQ